MSEREQQGRIHRAWVATATALADKAGAVLAVCVVLSVVLGFGATKLTFATGQDSYLNKDSAIAQDNREYQDLFGGEAMLTAFSVPEGQSILDMFTPANQQKMKDLQAQLADLNGVRDAVTPLSALQWTADLVAAPPGKGPTDSIAGKILSGAILKAPTPEEAATRTEDGVETITRAAAAGEQSLDNPKWLEFLLIGNDDEIRPALRPFFPVPPGEAYTAENATHALMITRLEGNQALSDQSDAAQAVVDAVDAVDFAPASTTTTGAPMLLKDVNDYLQGGMLVLGGLAVVAMIIVLSLAFRVRTRLLPLVAMLVGVIWAFGLLGYTGFKLSLVTIAGLPILIGLGVEFAIQMHNRVEEEVALDHPRGPFGEALRNIGPALVVATVAAVLACLALLVSKVPMIREFGILLAVGIVMLFFAAIVIPITVLAIREKRSPTVTEHRQPLVEKSMRTLAHLPQVLVLPIVVIAIGFFAAGLVVEEKTPIQTDPQKWVDQSSQTVKDVEQVADDTATATELGVFVTAPDVFSDDAAAFVSELGIDQLETFPDTLVTASSLSTTVYYLMNFPGVTPVLPSGADLKAAYDVAPPEIKDATVAQDGTAANLTFQVGPSSLEDRKVIVDDIRVKTSPEGELAPPTGISATPAGLAVVGVGLLQNLTENRLMLTYVALGLVALWLLLRMRSFVKTILVLLPVVLAVGLASTIVYLTGITVSPLTTVSGPLVIAICTEFATLIMFRHIEERRQGLDPMEAVDVAATRTGRAFFASALTTVAGFAVMLVSPLPLLKDFGAIVAITVAIALLSAGTVLPPVLVWADKRGLVKLGKGAEPVDESRSVDERASAASPEA
jgi:hydrophobe/amphiphile efflux-3 (HAE3) family protein